MSEDPAPDKSRNYGYRYGSKENPDPSGWGTLPPYDAPEKGRGFFGMLPRSDDPASESSEYSIGVEVDGGHYHVPSLVPGLTQSEVKSVLEGRIPDTVYNKAARWAADRISRKLPVFALPEEEGTFIPAPD